MKLWIDDERPAPDEDWTVVTTSSGALRELRHARDRGEVIIEVSFDHDLGGDDTTRRVMYWMASSGHWPSIVTVHSANPPGHDYLYGMAEHYAPSTTTVRHG